MLDQMGQPGTPLGVVVAADLKEHQEHNVVCVLNRAHEHGQAIIEPEPPRYARGDATFEPRARSCAAPIHTSARRKNG